MVDTCRIIKSESKLIIIEIDTENNRELIDDLSKNIFMKNINQRRAEKKIGRSYILGNLFETCKIDFLSNMRFNIKRVKILENMAEK